jgi:histone H3/H4
MSKLMTTSLLITEDQNKLLKKLAASRMMRGQMQNASVSEVIRDLIAEHEAAFKSEIAGSL